MICSAASIILVCVVVVSFSDWTPSLKWGGGTRRQLPLRNVLDTSFLSKLFDYSINGT